MKKMWLFVLIVMAIVALPYATFAFDDSRADRLAERMDRQRERAEARSNSGTERSSKPGNDARDNERGSNKSTSDRVKEAAGGSFSGPDGPGGPSERSPGGFSAIDRVIKDVREAVGITDRAIREGRDRDRSGASNRLDPRVFDTGTSMWPSTKKQQQEAERRYLEWLKQRQEIQHFDPHHGHRPHIPGEHGDFPTVDPKFRPAPPFMQRSYRHVYKGQAPPSDDMPPGSVRR